MTDPDVVAVCGSLRDDSHTRTALRELLDAAAAAGADAELLDLRVYDLPVYDGDASEAGDAAAFRERLQAADAIVLGTPVYHGTYASPLKAALDYCRFDAFEGKPVGLLAVAGGQFPTPALSHLRETCRILHADVLSHQVAIPDVDSHVDDGRLVDDDHAERVAQLARQVVDAAEERRTSLAVAGG
jgi:NAD(P)H-dependent FMN reductase